MTPTDNYEKNPSKNEKSIVGINDQLIKILEIIGKQKQENLDFINEETTLKYLNNVQDVVT